MNQIDYYLFSASPFAYLGHHLFHDIAERHGLTVNYKIIDIMAVWGPSGSVPVGQRTPIRQRYRRVELKRLAEFRGLPLNVDPTFFPVDFSKADLCATAIVAGGGNPKDFLWRTGKCVWADGENLADEAVLARMLSETGHDADAIIAASKSPATAEIRQRNSVEATAADAIGAPVYVYKGEPFWGQDRLEHLDRMLATGRPPFRP